MADKKTTPKKKTTGKQAPVKKEVARKPTAKKEAPKKVVKDLITATIVGRKFIITVSGEVINKAFKSNAERDEIQAKLDVAIKKPTSKNLAELVDYLKPSQAASRKELTEKEGKLAAEKKKTGKDIDSNKSSLDMLQAAIDKISTSGSEEEKEKAKKMLDAFSNSRIKQPAPVQSSSPRRGEY